MLQFVYENLMSVELQMTDSYRCKGLCMILMGNSGKWVVTIKGFGNTSTI